MCVVCCLIVCLFACVSRVASYCSLYVIVCVVPYIGIVFRLLSVLLFCFAPPPLLWVVVGEAPKSVRSGEAQSGGVGGRGLCGI